MKELIFEEKVSIAGIKYFEHTEEVFTLPPGDFEVVDNFETLKIVSSSNIKFDFTNDDITMRKNLKMNATKKQMKQIKSKIIF